MRIHTTLWPSLLLEAPWSSAEWSPTPQKWPSDIRRCTRGINQQTANISKDPHHPGKTTQCPAIISPNLAKTFNKMSNTMALPITNRNPLLVTTPPSSRASPTILPKATTSRCKAPLSEWHLPTQSSSLTRSSTRHSSSNDHRNITSHYRPSTNTSTINSQQLIRALPRTTAHPRAASFLSTQTSFRRKSWSKTLWMSFTITRPKKWAISLHAPITRRSYRDQDLDWARTVSQEFHLPGCFQALVTEAEWEELREFLHSTLKSRTRSSNSNNSKWMPQTILTAMMGLVSSGSPTTRPRESQQTTSTMSITNSVSSTNMLLCILQLILVWNRLLTFTTKTIKPGKDTCLRAELMAPIIPWASWVPRTGSKRQGRATSLEWVSSPASVPTWIARSRAW